MEVLCKDATLGFYNEFGIYNVPIGQYDIGRIISITFMNEGELFQIPDGTIVFFKALKPDGNEINTDKYCYINRKTNAVEICVFNQLSIVSGVVQCEIILANSEGQRYTSSHFNIVVNSSVSNDEHLKSMDEYRDIVGILVEIEGLKKDLIFKSDVGQAGGIASLDENAKVPRYQLYEADLDNKGIVKLIDSVTSDSTTDAVTPKSVKTVNDKLQKHIDDKDNPHEVTKEQLGLGNVDNTSDNDKPVSSAQQSAIDASISNHNNSDLSHNDIRTLISTLTTRLNTLADSDDETLDQLSEIVSYIKNNKDLIDSITTSKVNVSDIVDNLTSTDSNKPLAANQGKILRELISDLENSITGGTGSSNYTDEDKEIVDSFKNLTVEDAKKILNGTYVAPDPPTPTKTLTEITVTNPTKTNYVVGENLDLTGCVVTAHYDNDTTLDVTSSATFNPDNGTTLTTEMSNVTISYTENDITKTTNISIVISTIPTIVSFSDATDEELSNLLSQHYAGEINLADHWNVGDERVVHLSAMENWNTNNATIITGQSTFGELQPEQDATLVIIDFNVDTLKTSINGCTKAAITLQLKDCLSNQGIIDANYALKAYNYETISTSWGDCDRRQWCNNVFKNSLPSSLSNLIKLINKSNPSLDAYGNGTKYAEGNLYAGSVVSDYCFLLSGYEMKHKYYSSIDKYNDQIQYQYYVSGGSSNKQFRWWLRNFNYSGQSDDNITISCADNVGGQFMYSSAGIAPAFCL